MKRPHVQSIDDILQEHIPVLDHGFIRIIDYMGDDNAVVQAARVSYGQGTKKTSEDQALINYLVKNKHTSPFEMCEIKLHIKLPIFIARQFVRHRTANINEYSGRYSLMTDDSYIPDIKQLCYQSTLNKQGRDAPMEHDLAKDIQAQITAHTKASHELYKNLIDHGLTRELARIILPLNCYTEWYWKIDLHNLLRFCALRADHHAQYEIQCYANAILEIIKIWVPAVYSAFINYQKDAMLLSASMIDVLKAWLSGTPHDESSLSKREKEDLCKLKT